MNDESRSLVRRISFFAEPVVFLTFIAIRSYRLGPFRLQVIGYSHAAAISGTEGKSTSVPAT